MKKYQSFFYLKTFQFLEVKFSIYLNRRVFVMCFDVFLGPLPSYYTFDLSR